MAERPCGGNSHKTLEVIIHDGRYEGRQRYPLTRPRMTIGRALDNDIVIPSEVVSPHHAEIIQQEGRSVLVDTNSLNGIWYQGQRVSQQPLAHGAVFRIGDPTGVLVTLRFDAGSGVPLDQGTQPAPQQVALAGAPVVTIGRAPDNTIQLDHPMISWHHATLAPDPRTGSATLADRGSMNGTFVNGWRIRGRVRLVPGDEVRIGPYRLTFRDMELIQQDERTAIRVDAYQLYKETTVSRWKRWFRHARPKVLLDHISLSIPPRTFAALVGGSGAGKTMLLDALSGMRPAQQGVVLYNGNDAYRHRAAFSPLLGYVPQEDILHHDLTVERALYYTARLRLPGDSTHAQIEQRIADVLATMEITACRKMRIGTLSGGQRKRASIALELLAQPSLFFLDEPTSGLDPGLDRHIMFLLRRLADRGHTIILTTHTTYNIAICDALCFLAQGGRLVYAGPPDKARQFFDKTDFAAIYSALEPNDDHPNAPSAWEERFYASSDYQRYVTRPLRQANVLNQVAQAQQVSTLPPPKRGQPFKQLILLVRRYVELLRNDPVNLLILLLQAPVIAVILMALTSANIFAQHMFFNEMDVQTPLFVMVMAAIWFGTLNAAREIVKEAPIYRRERTINLGLVPYVFSKVFVLGLLCLLQSFLLLFIVGLRSGYPTRGILLPPFLEMYLSLVLTALGGLAMGLLVSALAPNTDRAISMVPLLLIAQIIFAGNIFKLNGAAAWVSYIMLARWGMMALGSTNDLHAQATGTSSNFYGHNLTHLLEGWLALIGLTLLFLGLTFFFQKRKDVRF